MNNWRCMSFIFVAFYVLTINLSVAASESKSAENSENSDVLFESAKKIYNKGNASLEDIFVAQKQFELACEKDEFKSCYYLAKIFIKASKTPEAYQNRSRKTRYLSTALDLLEKACEEAVVKACAELGFNLYGGYLGKKDDSRATDVSRWACDQGDAFACRVLAFHMPDSADSMEIDLQKSLYEKSCRIGGINGSWGCYYIAKNYQVGVNGFSLDLDQAKSNYIRACDQGNPSGCTSAAEMIQNENSSEPLVQHRARALFFLEKACDGGRKNICEELGKPPPELTRSKKGCENNELYFCHLYARFLTGSNSIDILKKNCQLGYSDSCVWLGNSRQLNNRQEAHNYLRIACDDGHGRGCYFLGKNYFDGEVVKTDTKKAMKFFLLACNTYDVESACRALRKFPED